MKVLPSWLNPPNNPWYSELTIAYCNVAYYQRPRSGSRCHRVHRKYLLLYWGYLHNSLLLDITHETALPAHAHIEFSRIWYFFTRISALNCPLRLRIRCGEWVVRCSFWTPDFDSSCEPQSWPRLHDEWILRAANGSSWR
jgi:hypothetical protein